MTLLLVIGDKELEVTRMSTRYELVEWEDLGYNLPQTLPYPRAKTIAGAVANIRSSSAHLL